MQQPLVLELKGNSLDDGPGIRTAIFFKGCPLSCIWCHNPESKHTYAELCVDLRDCIDCHTCEKVCPNGAMSFDNEGRVDRNKCKDCFTCTLNCPPKGLSRFGVEMSIEEIVKKCVSDKPFYDVSGGGVTLTGGECTMFPEWMGELCKTLKSEGINIHFETSGYFDYEKIEKYMLPYISSIYVDIKIIDREEHKKYCGVYSDLILENFERLFKDQEKYGFSVLPRTPLIPDITDTDEKLLDIIEFYKRVGVKNTELLAYNPTWYGKNDKLGIETNEELKGLTSFQPTDKINHCRELFLNEGINC